MPIVTSGFGPKRGISTAFDRLAETTTIAIIGRKATPVMTGEYPSDCCR